MFVTEIDKILFADQKGSLSLINLPFRVDRVWWIHNVPKGGTRGRHAHKESHQIIVCHVPKFQLWTIGKEGKNHFHFDRTMKAVYIPPMNWIDLQDFSQGSIAMVLASGPYDPEEIIDDYSTFQSAIGIPRHEGGD